MPWLKVAGMLAALTVLALGFLLAMGGRESEEIVSSSIPATAEPVVSNSVAGFPLGGKWSSTSGGIIVIPDSPSDFVLVVTHPDGMVFKLKAYWTKGKEGTQFAFVNEYGRPVVATLDPQNHNRVKLTVEDRVYYWQRI